MEYLLITNKSNRHPLLETDTRGFALTFSTYKAAKDYAEKYALENATVVAVCTDSKNYLV